KQNKYQKIVFHRTFSRFSNEYSVNRYRWCGGLQVSESWEALWGKNGRFASRPHNDLPPFGRRYKVKFVGVCNTPLQNQEHQENLRPILSLSA
ncbi:MAG: hypothetical protein KDE56_30065, partial [Anaerolineales bacterium]|nr:hypothetical protein [Anaerolineales bacterium]